MSFYELFNGMSLAAFMCITAGIMLVIVEFFHTTRFIAGGSGGVMISAGVVIRMLTQGTLGLLFLMLLLIAGVLFITDILILIFQKHDWLIQSLSIAINDSAINRSANYTYLKDLTGIATTDINFEGNISINDVNFFVNACEFIEKGSIVKVKRIEGGKIFVDKIERDFED